MNPSHSSKVDELINYTEFTFTWHHFEIQHCKQRKNFHMCNLSE